MKGIDKLASQLQKTINDRDKNKITGYDTQATVVKVTDDTIWVKIAGGIDETPVDKTVSCREGDSVQVRVSGHRAWIAGNYTSPATDDTRANSAYIRAETADEHAKDAQKSADIAKLAADSAVKDAARAYAAAETAEASATVANTAANNALSGLSTLESVVDTVNWFAEHKKATTDTTVNPSKTYYIFDSVAGTLSEVTPVGTENPVSEGWYELNEAISNYVASHVATTDDGLYVVGVANGWKVLVSSGENPRYPVGIHLIDPNGGKVQSTTASGISFDSTKEFYIGDEDAYIYFDGNGHITIGGLGITLGDNRTLSDLMNTVDNSVVLDSTYTIQDGTAYFEAHLYRGGADVKTQYDPAQFTWWLKSEESLQEQPIIPAGSADNSGYTTQVPIADCGYGVEVVLHFTTTEDSPLLNGSDDNLTDVNNNNLTGRTESGDSVRVRDLTVATTLYSTDKLMIVGSEDEHLVSIQTLQDYLNINLDKQVLFNTTAGWNAQTTLQSKANTLYIYTDHQTDSNNNPVAGIKVGDGNAYVVDLPFTDAIAMEHIADTTRHITASERAFWNNKVSCYYAGTENLIFTTA